MTTRDENFALALEGSRLSTFEAKLLERELTERPRDLEIRLKLLGYYGLAKFENARNWKKYRDLVFWIIENIPTHEMHGLSLTVLDHELNPVEYNRAK